MQFNRSAFNRSQKSEPVTYEGFVFGGFNTLPFNRLETADVYGSFVIDMNGDVSMLANVLVSPSFSVDLSGDALIEAFRERFGRFVLDMINEMVIDGTRERFGQFSVEANLEVSFAAGRMHVDTIEFNGEFKPGDQIIIDNAKLLFLLNNQNALHMMQGDFFDLNTGENELIYTDDQTGRTVRMRITYRDKYV